MRLSFSLLALISALAFNLVIPAAAAPLTFNGSAGFGPNGRIRLTPAAVGQAGSVWTTQKRTVRCGFRTSFQFRITDPGGIEGADGFAFVIQNSGLSALGSAGGGIGYHGIPRSIAIEFDTYANFFGGVSDPDNNHVSIHTNGFGPNSVDEAFSIGGPVSTIPNLSDGNVHSVKIAWYAGLLTVVIDGSIVLQEAVDLSPVLDAGKKTWFGFTSATGAGYEIHDIGGWCLATF